MYRKTEIRSFSDHFLLKDFYLNEEEKNVVPGSSSWWLGSSRTAATHTRYSRIVSAPRARSAAGQGSHGPSSTGKTKVEFNLEAPWHYVPIPGRWIRDDSITTFHYGTTSYFMFNHHVYTKSKSGKILGSSESISLQLDPVFVNNVTDGNKTN